MSLIKRELARREEASYDLYDDKYVCDDCLDDGYLSARISEEKSDERNCSYCGNSGAAKLEVLCQLMQEALDLYYSDPAEVLYHDSSDGGYQGDVLDGNEIIQTHFPVWSSNDDLVVDVGLSFIASNYCSNDVYLGSEEESLKVSWENFNYLIKHKTRYLFFEPEDQGQWYESMIHPAKVLDIVGDFIANAGLIRTIAKSTPFYRARVVEKGISLSKDEEMGSPPDKYANMPNRMSAAGISNFYAGFDEYTAVSETYDSRKDDGDKSVFVAIFENEGDLSLLDLTRLPEIPSFFDCNTESVIRRRVLIFLKKMISEFVKPVDRDRKAHIEYVPTQVFTEFVRFRLHEKVGLSIDGILYESSRGDASNAVVIFANNEQCCNRSNNQILKMKCVYRLDSTVNMNAKAELIDDSKMR